MDDIKSLSDYINSDILKDVCETYDRINYILEITFNNEDFNEFKELLEHITFLDKSNLKLILKELYDSDEYKKFDREL